jgi:serine/threonine protein kinase
MNIFNRYTTERKLGEGTFSVTYLARTRSGEKVAVKHIQKDRVKEEDWVNELEILRTLQKHPHPNIVSCFDILEDDHNVYIVEELLPGGDLLQYLTKHAPLKEVEVKKNILDCSLCCGALALSSHRPPRYKAGERSVRLQRENQTDRF